MSVRKTAHLLRRVIKHTVAGIGEDELMTRAAALAFYSALSFAPLLVLLLWLLSSLRPEWQQQMLDQLTATVGTRAADAVRLVLDNARSRPGFGKLAGLISLGITLFSASAVFAQMQGAINRIWGLRPRPGRAWMDWVRTRAHALGLLLALVFLLIISFAISALIGTMVRGHNLAWQLLEILIALCVFSALFASIFKVLPDAFITWRDALIGASLTAVLFAIGKLGIGLYLDVSSVGGAYGPASSIVVLLVWVYYAGIILLLGAELTQAVATERGHPIRPRHYAETFRIMGPEAASPAPASEPGE